MDFKCGYEKILQLPVFYFYIRDTQMYYFSSLR